MKKIIKFILPILLLVSLGINLNLILSKNPTERFRNSEDKNLEMYKYLDSMQLANFEAKYNTGQKLVVYIGRPTCEDCNNFDKIFVKYIKQYDLSSKIIYVNVDELYKNKSKWERFKQTYDIKGTPSLVIYENKKVISKLDFEEMHGFTPDDIKKWMMKNNLAEESGK